MAAPAYTYSLTNGTTADASQVMQDFNDILNGVTDGTKDLTMSALTANGAANLKAAVTLGASTSNDLTISGALASTIAIKTNNSFAIGSATKGLSGVFLGNGGVGATCQIISASHATTRNYTVPDCGAAASFVMTQGTQTVAGATTFSASVTIGTAGTPAGYTPSALSVYQEEEDISSSLTSTGWTSAPAFTAKATRVGKTVSLTLKIPDTNKAATTSGAVGFTGMPARYLDGTTEHRGDCYMEGNSAIKSVLWQMTTAGALNFYSDAAGSSWASGAVAVGTGGNWVTVNYAVP